MMHSQKNIKLFWGEFRKVEKHYLKQHSLLDKTFSVKQNTSTDF